MYASKLSKTLTVQPKPLPQFGSKIKYPRFIHYPSSTGCASPGVMQVPISEGRLVSHHQHNLWRVFKKLN